MGKEDFLEPESPGGAEFFPKQGPLIDPFASEPSHPPDEGVSDQDSGVAPPHGRQKSKVARGNQISCSEEDDFFGPGGKPKAAQQ